MTGAATGKLLLFGEHAAVYGLPALGLGVPWGLRVRFVAPREGDEGGAAAARLRDACDRIGAMPPPSGALAVRSEIPFGVGLGSSAALCVALARAVGGGAERDPWGAAHRAEHAFHGSPSGIDTGLAVLGGVQRFTAAEAGRPPAAQPLAVPELFLVVGYVPRAGDTAAHVAAVRRRMQAGEAEVRSAIDRLGAIALHACPLLAASAADRAAGLGALADEADELLGRIGVGSPVVAELLAAARFAGATGGKISGGGGGGAFLAFVDDRDAGRTVLDAVGARLPPGGDCAAALLAVERGGASVLATHGWPAPSTRRVTLLDDAGGPA